MDKRGVWVQDLGSLNGTLLNGARIARKASPAADATCAHSPRQELNDGDELRICNNVFAVCLLDADRAPSHKDTMRWIESSPEVQHALAG